MLAEAKMVTVLVQGLQHRGSERGQERLHGLRYGIAEDLSRNEAVGDWFL